MAAGDHAQNFYLWGGMGSAAMIGLGLATAQPDKPVLVLTGDGEMLMGMGALATVVLRKPANLTIAVLDNGHYGETGMQPSHTGQGVPLARVAQACGFPWAGEISDMAGIATLRARIAARQGLGYATIRIVAENPPRVLPPRDGVFLKSRFRAALGLAPT
jgi:thiamine pyrophosphate-dependent acetolactate synthase large subunit-like protein